MGSLTTIGMLQILLILALVYLSYIDLRTFRLPDAITIPMMTAGLLFNYFPNLGLTSFSNALTGAILGYTSLWGLNIMYRWVKKQHGIGMGDAKLLAALGAWFGASALPELLFIASIGGLVGGLIWLRFQKQSIRTAFPFGPFLAIAGIIELLWPQILQTYIQSPLI